MCWAQEQIKLTSTVTKAYSNKLKLRIHWRLWTILKTSNTSVRSNAFIFVKVFIFRKCIQDTTYWDKTQMLKKRFFRTKLTIQKMLFFFFHKVQHITVLLLIYDSFVSWSTRFVSLKLCVGFPIFDSVLFLLKFMVLLNKCIDSLALKRHNFFQN